MQEEAETKMYITQAALENYLKRALATREANSFALVEGAAERVVNDYCDTTFEDVAETSHYFDGGDQEITIDPCHTITAIASINYDESIINEYSDNDYVLEPRNGNIKDSIILRDGRWPSGHKNIKVTGKFSSYYDEVPSDIQLAVMMLCGDYFNNPVGLKSESIEGYSKTLAGKIERDEEIKSILGSYRQVLL